MFEGVVITDENGDVKDEAWLRGRFGNIQIRKAEPGDGYRVIALHENRGAAVLQLMVLDKDGNLAGGILTARRWPYHEPNPGLEPLPPVIATWFDSGPCGRTKDDGVNGFGTGGGDVYWPQDGDMGASTIWVEGRSDAVEGLGILQETGYPHIEPVFQFKSDTPPPPDEIRKLIMDAKLDLVKANLRLDEALRLLL